MPAQLNHTIASARDPEASALFLAAMLGLPAPVRLGPFYGVTLANGATIDFLQDEGEITIQHYAFLVNEEEFDEIFARIEARGLPHWADPRHQMPGRINRNDGGRGVYWSDPNGHYLEILTRPYGGAAPLAP
jgi:catechol 2,3-dioxygenase-like lactoylglutathione lyase family enzyme